LLPFARSAFEKLLGIRTHFSSKATTPEKRAAGGKGSMRSMQRASLVIPR